MAMGAMDAIRCEARLPADPALFRAGPYALESVPE